MGGPKQAVIAVTYNCNGRCTMCNIWKQKHSKGVAPSVYRHLPASLKTVNITGGEPFLRKDLAQIIAAVKAACGDPRIVISTNGLEPALIEEQLSNLLRVKRDIGVRVSLDGTAETHGRIRGVGDAFDRAVTSINICRKMGVKDLGLAFTILDENVEELKAVYDISKRLKVQFAVSIAQNAQIFFCIDTIRPVGSTEKLKEQLEAVAGDQLKSWSAKNWVRAYYLWGLYDYSKGLSPLKSCTAADDFFFMDPDGSIYICPILDMKLGNLTEKTFDDIWESAAAVDARRFASSCPRRCWMACTVTPFIRKNIAQAALWVLSRKIMAHLGKGVIRP